jgi:hypothetical protein
MRTAIAGAPKMMVWGNSGIEGDAAGVCVAVWLGAGDWVGVGEGVGLIGGAVRAKDHSSGSAGTFPVALG